MAGSTRVVPAGRGLIRVGAVLFALGVIAVLVTVVPFAAGEHDRPLWLNLCCLAAPLGVALAVGGAIRGGRARRRAAVRQVAARR